MIRFSVDGVTMAEGENADELLKKDIHMSPSMAAALQRILDAMPEGASLSMFKERGSNRIFAVQDK